MAKSRKKVLAAVHPNVGVEIEYRHRLRALIEEMNRSVLFWLKAAYRRDKPVMAQDASPADELQREIDKLTRQWRGRFDEGAAALADFFAQSARRRSDEALRSILRRSGLSVKFKMTRAMRDVLNATIQENIALIKSIPQQYLTQVQGSVMRSVQTGRDLEAVAKDIRHHYGVSYRRAAFIARDQNNKATAVMHRARQTELGIEKAIWLHSHGGRTPRRTHLANSGKVYDVKIGWFDPDPKVRKRIWPGELPRCRCVAKAVIEGLS